MCLIMSYPSIAEPKSEDMEKVWSFCKKRSKSIEVFYRNMDEDKVLTKVHFQFDPVVRDCTIGSILVVMNGSSLK